MGRELALAERFGVRHTVGDTVGPAGFSRALRHLPAMLEIANKMLYLCPKAILFNTTNPLTPLCTAISRSTGIRTIGVCQEPIHVLRALCCLFNLSVHETDLDYTVWGINHFSWFTSLTINGIPFRALWQSTAGLRSRTRFVDHVMSTAPVLNNELIPILVRMAALFEYTHGADLDPAIFARDIQPLLLSFMLYNETGLMPASRPRHFIEFMPAYLNRTNNWGEKLGVARTSIASRILFREQHRQKVKETIQTGLGDFSASDRILIPILSAIVNNRQLNYPVNVVQYATDSRLPDHILVESNLEDRKRAGVDSPALDGFILTTIERTAESFDMLIEGFTNQDHKMMKAALLRDPNSINVFDPDGLYSAIQLLNYGVVKEKATEILTLNI
jgi:alpha-galactosidase